MYHDPLFSLLAFQPPNSHPSIAYPTIHTFLTPNKRTYYSPSYATVCPQTRASSSPLKQKILRPFRASSPPTIATNIPTGWRSFVSRSCIQPRSTVFGSLAATTSRKNNFDLPGSGATGLQDDSEGVVGPEERVHVTDFGVRETTRKRTTMHSGAD